MTAARKSIDALLLTRGWRVTGRGGGHQATVALVDAWLGPAPPPGPRIARKFAAAVVARHCEEYPHPRDPARTDRELRELTLDNVRLMNLARQVLGLTGAMTSSQPRPTSPPPPTRSRTRRNHNDAEIP